jgi:hypothetical protein
MVVRRLPAVLETVVKDAGIQISSLGEWGKKQVSAAVPDSSERRELLELLLREDASCEALEQPEQEIPRIDRGQPLEASLVRSDSGFSRNWSQAMLSSTKLWHCVSKVRFRSLY